MKKNTYKNIFYIIVLSLLTQSFYYTRNTNAQESEGVLEPLNTVSGNTDTEGQFPLGETPVSNNPATEIPVNTALATQIPSQNSDDQTLEENIIIEEIDQTEEMVSKIYVPPANLPKILATPLEKKIKIDESAKHACRVEGFTADMTSFSTLEKKILLSGPLSSARDIEVMGVPKGFNIKFTKNNQSKTLVNNDSHTNIKIERTPMAQKGNFNVSFILTEKSAQNSSVTCQINLINR